MYIIRGNECQEQLNRHLEIALEILRNQPSSSSGRRILSGHGLQFLPYVIPNIRMNPNLHLETVTEEPQPWPNNNTGTPFTPISSQERRKYRRSFRRELQSNVYTSLNSEQRSFAETTASLALLHGSPGTGKTKTLAALVLNRMQRLLNAEKGWVLILTHSNFSALEVIRQLSKYPSLSPLIRYSYSKMYHAYHPQFFEHTHEYRITPKMKLKSHGIMICTIGRFPHVLEKFEGFSHYIEDLITDESGLIWDFDALLILPYLEKLRRWYMLGDTRQLCPYVTRFVNIWLYFNSIMTLPGKLQPHVYGEAVYDYSIPISMNHSTPQGKSISHVVHWVRLGVQYRMNRLLSITHAPIFYNYAIETFRKRMSNPTFDGLYYEPLISRQEQLPDYVDSTFDYELLMIQLILAQVYSKQLCDEQGNPYTVHILSPFTRTVEGIKLKLEHDYSDTNMTPRGRIPLQSSHSQQPDNTMVIRRGDTVNVLPRNVPIISTIDTAQGCEANVVILSLTGTTAQGLQRCIHRANVACSRAKDILIILAHPSLLLQTLQNRDTGQRELSPYAMVVHKAKPWSPNNSNANRTLYKLSQLYEKFHPTETHPHIGTSMYTGSTSSGTGGSISSSSNSISSSSSSSSNSISSSSSSSISSSNSNSHSSSSSNSNSSSKFSGHSSNSSCGSSRYDSNNSHTHTSSHISYNAPGCVRTSSRDQTVTTLVLSNVQQMHRQRQSVRVNKTMQLARARLSGDPSTCRLSRSDFLFLLCLKRNDRSNLDFQRALFVSMCDCTEADFHTAVKIYADTYDYVERNTKLRSMFNINMHAPLPDPIRIRVAAVYRARATSINYA